MRDEVARFLLGDSEEGARRRRPATMPSEQPLIALREDLTWPNAVNGTPLLEGLEGFFARYLVLPAGGALAVACWTVGTYLPVLFDAFPYLIVSSPERECGKTRLLEVLEAVVYRPLRVAGISEAALFRVIEASRPALLIDEGQALRRRDDRSAALHDLLCAGNRKGAFVLRVGGQRHDRVERFSVYSPKAIALIGAASDIITSRAVEIPMRRRKTSERVERFFFGRAEAEAVPLRRQIVRWVADADEAVRETYQRTPPPEFLQDREAENWSPLFAVMQVADPARLPDLEQAARLLTGAKAEGNTPSDGVRLLADIYSIFEERGDDRLPTKTLLEALTALDGSGWEEYQRGKPLMAKTLADLLRPFGIGPRTVRLGRETVKGYLRDDFIEPWSRFLPSHLSQPTQDAGNGRILDPSRARGVTDSESGQSSHQDCVVTGVTGEGAQQEGECPPQCAPDDGRRALLLRMGEELGWPKLPYKPGISLAAGAAEWRMFAQVHGAEEIARVLAVLEKSVQ